MQIMRMFLLLAMAAFVVACGSSTSTEEATEETAQDGTEEMATEETPAPTATAMSGENFQVIITEDGIPSPRKEMTGTIEAIDVTVDYGSPSVKGRTIWGDLEAYGEVWRTGANKATSIEFAQDVLVGGEPLAAGRYAFFTIPAEEGPWTVIFSSNADQNGAFEYNEEQDALRIMVEPTMVEASKEELDFMIDNNNVVLAWEKLQLPISVAAAE